MKYSMVRRWMVWTGRIGRCRGFGVQSPWAYRMVRYVINEHWPYYAYGTLAARFPGLGVIERRVCELCLRLANHLQPRLTAVYGVGGDALGSYVKAGCRLTELVEAGGDVAAEAGFVVIAPCEGFEQVFYGACAAAKDGRAVMLLDIRRGKAVRRLWRSVVAEMQGVVTFDLYYCGLVFFDKKRFKQNYVINF